MQPPPNSATSPPSTHTQPPRTQPQVGHLYDVAIVGAGLAGSELALRLAAGGRDVLLVTQALDHVGNLYAPTLAGADLPPHTHLGALAEELRAEAGGAEVDTWTFHRRLKQRLEHAGNLHLLQSTVMGLEVAANSEGASSTVQLATWEGQTLHARRAVLAVGAFLHGRLSVGEVTEEAGRLSEVAYDFLAGNLQAAGTATARCTQEAAAVEGAPPYTVAFDVLESVDESGAWQPPHLYAVGRCTPHAATYAEALAGTEALAAHLLLTPSPFRGAASSEKSGAAHAARDGGKGA